MILKCECHRRQCADVQVLAIVYIGVTVSDMVTFFLGSALRRGLFRTLKQRLFK